MNEITALGAVELCRLIGSRQLSPLEVFDGFAARIERYNPALNALVEMRLDAARDEARSARRSAMSRSGTTSVSSPSSPTRDASAAASGSVGASASRRWPRRTTSRSMALSNQGCATSIAMAEA